MSDKIAWAAVGFLAVILAAVATRDKRRALKSAARVALYQAALDAAEEVGT